MRMSLLLKTRACWTCSSKRTRCGRRCTCCGSTWWTTCTTCRWFGKAVAGRKHWSMCCRWWTMCPIDAHICLVAMYCSSLWRGFSTYSTIHLEKRKMADKEKETVFLAAKVGVFIKAISTWPCSLVKTVAERERESAIWPVLLHIHTIHTCPYIYNILSTQQSKGWLIVYFRWKFIFTPFQTTMAAVMLHNSCMSCQWYIYNSVSDTTSVSNNKRSIVFVIWVIRRVHRC